jgi:serine/threonine protein kinase
MADAILDGLPSLFESDELPWISEMGQDLIRAMLQRDPEDRPTAEEALAHPWFDAVREVELSEDGMKFASETTNEKMQSRVHECEW